MFVTKSKIDTLFWIAMLALILTSIYTVVLAWQGVKTKKMIRYIFAQTKKREGVSKNSNG